jgi:hypothetical protein
VGKGIKKSKINLGRLASFSVEGFLGPQAKGPTTPCGTHFMGERHKVTRLQITIFKSPSVYSNHENLDSSLSTYLCPQLQIPEELWKRGG